MVTQRHSFRKSLTHKYAVLSLYKSLLRNVNKLALLSIPSMTIDDKRNDINKEVAKISINQRQYLKNVKAELGYIVREEFRSTKKGEIGNPNKFRERFIEAIRLQEILEYTRHDSTSWIQLIVKLLNYRSQKHLEQYWRSEYLRDPEEINNGKNKEKPTLLVKQMESRSKKPKITNFKKLSQKEKSNRYKTELIKCNENSQKLLRRYLKELQTSNKIPIPHLLPYTSEKSLLPLTDAVSLSLTIPGSTCRSSIASAYDLDYIDTIIKPSLEHDINKCHYLDHLKSIADEKGPFKVQINITEAGPMSIPYIKLPYKRDELQEVGMDIKKLMRLIRLKTVWNSSDNESSITEPQFSDGSYAVRGSRGFGEEERIHPRHYYEKLAVEEGIWEFLISNQDKNENASLDSPTKLINEWQDALEIATTELNNDVNYYYQKYNALKSSKSPLLQDQKILQQKMNLHYDDQLNRYNHITKLINNHNIIKHSEIVNLSNVVTKKYDKYLVKNDRNPSKKHQKGMPALERIGMGKRLADYLDDVGYHYFKWGMKFDKKLKI